MLANYKILPKIKLTLSQFKTVANCKIITFPNLIFHEIRHLYNSWNPPVSEIRVAPRCL